MHKSTGACVFLADLHYPGGTPPEIDVLLSEIPSSMQRLFLLGDIFHFWINDRQLIENLYAPFLQ
ncbi:MAG: hypothetical protein ACP5I1_17175, partial [Candidatus Hinthialibacter sp.]